MTETNWIQDAQAYITHTKIAGIVPLDAVAHFSVGMLVTIILLKCKIRFWIAIIIVCTLGLGKEFYDSFTLNNDFDENIMDTIATLGYPIILSMARFLKDRINENQGCSR